MARIVGISILLHCMLLSGIEAQRCAGFLMNKEFTVCIDEIISLQEGVTPAALPDDIASRQDIALFRKYFSHQTLAGYRALFPPQDWSGLSEPDYLEWQQNLSSYPVSVEAIVTFWHNSRQWSAILYRSEQSPYVVRDIFLSKQIAHEWYPTSQEEDARYTMVAAALRTLKPEFLTFAFDKTAPGDQLPDGFAEIKSQIVTGNTINTTSLLTRQGQEWARQYGKVFYHLNERLQPQQDYARDRQRDHLIVHYMDSLEIGMIQQEVILGLIREFNYVKAAVRIAEFEDNTLNYPAHIEAIRRIYGADRIQSAQSN